METYVKRHKSHSKSGKVEEVEGHKMHVNPRIHARHLKRAEEEVREFEEKELHGGKKKVRV